MKLVRLYQKDEIETYLRRDPWLHIYEIGDLDDFFRPHTIWYGVKNGPEIVRLALLYTASSPPTLLAFSERDSDGSADFVRSLLPLLPGELHTHLSLPLVPVFEERYTTQYFETMNKMALFDPSALTGFDTSSAVSLSGPDIGELMALYQVGYPDNAFDPRMIETGCFFGIRRGGKLVTVAGIHVFSARYRVAAIGNVTTHPDFRGRGLAGAACAALCRFLLERVDHIGLNVRARNSQAIHLYKKLGFDHIADYGECTFVHP